MESFEKEEEGGWWVLSSFPCASSVSIGLIVSIGAAVLVAGIGLGTDDEVI